jgi:hypothetical protein
MYEAVRRTAFMSTARGCGFGGLAVLTAMMGLTSYPPGALKFGGLASLLAAAILILKAWRAPQERYKRTEVWLLLADADKPGEAEAQRLVAAARVEAFYRFALICAVVGAAFLVGALIAGGLWRG